MTALKALKAIATEARAGIRNGSLHNTPLHALREPLGRGALTEQRVLSHLEGRVFAELGQPLERNPLLVEQLSKDTAFQAELKTQANNLHNKLSTDGALQSLYNPNNWKSGFSGTQHHIVEDATHIAESTGKNKPNLFQKLRGETEETIAAAKEAKANAAESMAEMRADYAERGAAMKEQVKLDELELKHKVKSEKLETKLRQKHGLEKKPMGLAKKAVIGGGAVAGGIAGYNVLSGANVNAAPMMAEAENAGAQAAMNDAMAEMQMAAPMPQVQAANLNYEGPMMAGAQVARG